MVIFCLFFCLSQDVPANSQLWGLELLVDEPAKSVPFLVDGLGFELASWQASKSQILTLDEFRLLITPATTKGSSSQFSINMRVGDLGWASEFVREKGAKPLNDEPLMSAIGPFNTFEIPGSSQQIHLMQIDGDDLDAKQISLFNVSVNVKHMTQAEKHMTQLGFEVYSHEYLPSALPFKSAGAYSLVFHPSNRTFDGLPNAFLLFDTDDIKSCQVNLERLFGSMTVETRGVNCGPWLSLGGLDVKWLNAKALNPEKPRELYVQAFNQLASLAGEWVGTSTAGWTSDIGFRTIARNSVVIETTFDDHHDSAMMTTYHLDGDNLVLIHYCAARNQPRLEIESISEDMRIMEFKYAGGSNIAVRDKGHMDHVIYEFVSDDLVKAKWSWYQNGQESWMEEIELRRKPKSQSKVTKLSD